MDRKRYLPTPEERRADKETYERYTAIMEKEREECETYRCPDCSTKNLQRPCLICEVLEWAEKEYQRRGESLPDKLPDWCCDRYGRQPNLMVWKARRRGKARMAAEGREPRQ